MAQPKIKEFEVRFARAFLHYIHANEQNGYLLLAIIAWLRSESGQHYIGNNPLNIRNSKYAVAYRQTAKNGHFAIFKDLASAAKASAAFLMNNKGNGYNFMLAAARRAATNQTQQVEQAKDFLEALALSKWDAGHYGLPAADRTFATYDPSKNKLLFVWSALTGQPIPHQWFIDTAPPAPPPPKPREHQPRPFYHTMVEPDYLKPYASRSFYEDRKHVQDMTLPQDSLPADW